MLNLSNSMKRQNGVRAAYVAFPLHALQAGFGFANVLNTLKEAYPWLSIILHRRCLASFTEAH